MATKKVGSKPTTRKPGNPWNQYPKKPAAKPTAPARVLSSKTLPVGKPGGAVQSKGGSLVKTGSNGMSSPVKPVSVRDVTPPPRGLPAGQTRALSGGQQPSLSGGTQRLLSGKAGTVKIGNLKSGIAGLALGALSDKYLSPLAQKAGTALGKNVVIPAARALDDAMPGMNSKDERQRSKAKAIANQPVRSAYYSSSPNPPNASSTGAANAPVARSSASPSTSTTRSSAPVRNPAPQRTPAMVPQSKNMDENYTTWTKANKVLAEKVKPGQAGYDAIQKALGKTSSDTSAAKPTPKNGSSSGTDQAIRSIESDPKAKPFNTDKVPTKSDKDKLKDLQALRIAKRKAGVA